MTGLVATRHDIGCAVSGSGGPFGSGDNSVKDISRPVLNPLQFVPSIGRNNATRFLVVTDRQDLKVPASKQIEFVEKLRRAGRSIPQFFVTALNKNHHGVLSYTQLVSAGCILGKSDAEIATAVGTMVKRNAAFIDLRRTEMAALSKTGAPPKPPIDADCARWPSFPLIAPRSSIDATFKTIIRNGTRSGTAPMENGAGPRQLCAMALNPVKAGAQPRRRSLHDCHCGYHRPRNSR